MGSVESRGPLARASAGPSGPDPEAPASLLEQPLDADPGAISVGVQNPVFVMDNCRIHNREAMEALKTRTGIPTKFLPPWSPMLNPIEGVFSNFKHQIRTLITRDYAAEIVAISAMPVGEKGIRRGAILVRAFEAACPNLTVAVIDRHYQHLA